MKMNTWILATLFLVGFPGLAGATDHDNGGEPDETCFLWEFYSIPDQLLSPVITEGAFTIPAKRIESCGSGFDDAVTVTVEDDEGEIPGRVVLYTSSTENVLAWAPTSPETRTPTTEKNARATVRFVIEFDQGNLTAGELTEEGTFSLDVTTEATPDPAPPVIVAESPRLDVNRSWGESTEPCRRPEVTITWERGAQPPGTEALSAVDVISGSPEGTDSGWPQGTSGFVYRNYTAYAEEYCLMVGTLRPLIDDRTASAETVCYEHAVFEGLLEAGEQLCVGPPETDGPAPTAAADPRTATTRAVRPAMEQRP
jgi:hypothetical protein